VTRNRVRRLVDDVGRAVDGEAVPLLHRGAVDGLLVVRESHPGDRLGLGNLGRLEQLQCEGFVVELHGVDTPGGGPCPDHQMMLHGGAGSVGERSN